MNRSYPDQLQQIRGRIGHLAKELPDVMKSFNSLSRHASGAGALDSKTKELIALAIAVVTHCEDCLIFHTQTALQAGATREEIMETLGVALVMGGGPALMYATHVLEILDQLQAQSEISESVEPVS
jgi:AhpD family alkylhydroperoxidase